MNLKKNPTLNINAKQPFRFFGNLAGIIAAPFLSLCAKWGDTYVLDKIDTLEDDFD